MLDELRIRGLGVIDDAVLPFDSGLTVVTGETGAGKTMVVTGLALLFGGRAEAARVRRGVEQATVEGRLEIAADSAVATRVREAGGELDDDTGLVLRRVVSAAGRSRGHVGGAAAPVAVLAELAEQLVAVHGQSDQQRLTKPSQQRVALDRYAEIDLTEYAAAYARWRDAEAVLADRTARMGELRREADLLAHGIAEIDTVAPEPSEDVELTALSARLMHAEGLRSAARQAHDLVLGDVDASLDEQADVLGLLGTAGRSLAQQTGADPSLDALADRLGALASMAQDVGSELRAYADQLDLDPRRVDEVESRRAALNNIVRKYGVGLNPDVASVLRWRAESERRLAEIDVSDEALSALATARDTARRQVRELAASISRVRRDAAVRLAEAVTTELAGLAMPSARLIVDVRPRQMGAVTLDVDGGAVGAGPDGIDEVQFLLQSHPQAPELPVARAASGGELSRIMLALELCLAATDPVPTMVFDEVDAGVGGRAAVEIGRRLSRLAWTCQVVVVTHLAQVAAFADHHLVVDRAAGASDSRPALNNSDVHVVTGDERRAELARMLAGSDSATALEHAAELLADAQRGAGRRIPTSHNPKGDKAKSEVRTSR